MYIVIYKIKTTKSNTRYCRTKACLIKLITSSITTTFQFIPFTHERLTLQKWTYLGVPDTHHSSLSRSQWQRGGAIFYSVSTISSFHPRSYKWYGCTSMSKNGSTSSQSSSPLMAPLKSKQPDPEAELTLLELEWAICLSMLHVWRIISTWSKSKHSWRKATRRAKYEVYF